MTTIDHGAVSCFKRIMGLPGPGPLSVRDAVFAVSDERAQWDARVLDAEAAGYARGYAAAVADLEAADDQAWRSAAVRRPLIDGPTFAELEQRRGDTSRSAARRSPGSFE